MEDPKSAISRFTPYQYRTQHTDNQHFYNKNPSPISIPTFLVGLLSRIFVLYFIKVPNTGNLFCMFFDKSCSPLRKVAYKCRTTDPQLRNPLLSGLRGSLRPIAEPNVNPVLPFPVGLLLARNHPARFQTAVLTAP